MKEYIDYFSVKHKIRRGVFAICWKTIGIFPGKLMNRVGLRLLTLFGAKIGKGCIVYSSARIWDPKNLKMGNYVVIGPEVNVYNVGDIELCDGVQVSQNAQLITATHDFNSPNHSLIIKTIQVGTGVWIAASASILPGIYINDWAVIGYGSIVTKSVESFAVMAGVPAKKIGERSKFDESFYNTP